jgi:hypothetical protein
MKITEKDKTDKINKIVVRYNLEEIKHKHESLMMNGKKASY